MKRVDYREVLWELTADEGEGNACLIRSFSDEAALFEATESRWSNAFTVDLPLTKLVGTRDSKTRWTQRPVTQFEALEAGRKLSQALPSELMDIFDQPATDPRPLRLKVYSPMPRITDLPWEWLTDRLGNPVALRPDVRLVRCVPVRFEVPHLTIPLPVKVMLVLTNPKDERLLNPYQEISIVAKRLVPPDYDMQVCPEPTVELFKSMLHEFQPHVVHYIGHSGINNGEGNLILHDSYNRTSWMPGSFLARILPSTVRLICLSTCITTPNYQLLGLPHLADAEGDFNLPTVVTNRYPLDEQSASAFWETFYTALVIEEGNVNEAVHHGRIQAQNANPNSADWASFSVVLRDRSGKALNILKTAVADLKKIQASELEAKYAARLASDLAEQVSVYGEYATESVRETFRTATKEASDLLERSKKSIEGLS